jgi:hypothetical protein
MSQLILIKYPSNLPAPLLSTHSLKQQSNLLRTKMDSGHARVRRRFKSVPTVMTATWRCKAEQAAVFEGFITHALGGGVSRFLMNVLTPLGVIEHDVRFITSPLEDYQPISAIWWEYKAKIEIKQRKIMTEDEFYASVCGSGGSGSTTYINSWFNGFNCPVNFDGIIYFDEVMYEGGGGATTTARNFTQLTTAVGTYWEFSNTLEFQAGDTFEFEFLAPSSISPSQYLTGGLDANDRGYIFLNSAGNFQSNPSNVASIELDGVAIPLGSAYPVDGKLHKLKMFFMAFGKIKKLGARYTGTLPYGGTLANPVATIGGSTQTFTLANGVGADTEQSAEVGNTITRVNVSGESIEEFELSADKTQWDNISTAPQEMQAIIEIAP